MSDSREDRVAGPDEDAPETLASDRYAVALTAAKRGGPRLGPHAVTAWADDAAGEAAGFLIYVRDLETGRFWTLGHQARVQRVDEGVATVLELAIPLDAPAELRRLTLTDLTGRARLLEVTTYTPLALDTPAAFAAHPAFSKLFIQTAWLPALGGLAARRRPRGSEDPALGAVHLLVAPGNGDGVEWETDRARFIGRGRTLAAPRAMDPGVRLTGSVGNVLDPVLCLRRSVRLEAGAGASLVAILSAGMDLEQAEAVAARYANHAATPAPRRVSPSPVAPPVTYSAPAALDLSGAGPLPVPSPDGEPLRFFNGYGGFTADGAEYVIRLGTGPHGLRLPPLPWVNVVANERVGFVASETAAGCTWAGNSRLNRLTPWSNDPVLDPHGEALYLRDESDGSVWSPTPGPAPGAGPYEARHGFGYTRYRHESHGLEQDVSLFVPPVDPVKLLTLRLTNRTPRRRRLSAFGYFEWVLGGSRSETRSALEVDLRPDVGAVLARNPASEDFPGAIAFAAVAPPTPDTPVRLLADRAAFLGRAGVAAPAALSNPDGLPATEGRPADPCAAFQAVLELDPGEAVECTFLLGQADSTEAALDLVRRYRATGEPGRALESAVAAWRRLLGGVRVRTPSPELDLMVNGWLGYQNVSCRLRGRTAFYQSGGAYGFRDQLQDAMALVWLDPPVARRQILEHAAHQFPEGDVLHWWHPPLGRGIRTRFSDDLLWLPYVTAFYVDATGDAGVLDEPVVFVLDRELEPGEDEAYLTPGRSEETAELFEHCARAIDRSLTAGVHGLPLMGSGDWNDGMNRVGRLGRGESVWLGFFLATILDRWVSVARDRGEVERAERWAGYRARLGHALETAAWDGAWYRRAYYDDGAPIGSRESDECRIDAIAQAWAVLSGVARPDRAEQALDALEEHLVREDQGLIRLLTPPFDGTPRDPGYIKGYVPGVRENGGQYTHGVLWAVRALAEVGRVDRAARLLEMLTPVARTATADRVERYRAEPYVVAADVYAEPPHVGRAGWTWYTGSAAWMWRTAVESILGATLQGGRHLRIRPRIPSAWPGYELELTLPDGRTRYRIQVQRTDPGAGVARASLDGQELTVDGEAALVPLERDGGWHQVIVVLGADVQAAATPG